MTEGPAVAEVDLEDDAGPARVEEVPVGCAVPDSLGICVWPSFCAREGISSLGGFSLQERILWRKILRGSYSGSVPFSWDGEEISLASLNMLMRLLVYA